MIKFLIQQKTAPYQNSLGLEKQELAFTFAALGQHVDLLFSGDGVLQLVELPGNAYSKDFCKAYQGLGLFGVNAVYVDKDSALKHGIIEQICIPVAMLDDVSELISQYDVVI